MEREYFLVYDKGGAVKYSIRSKGSSLLATIYFETDDPENIEYEYKTKSFYQYEGYKKPKMKNRVTKRDMLQKIKGEFEKNLALLRKTGKNIDVLSIKIDLTTPFHDRFLITKKRAITTGTSISGLGMRDSVITGLKDWKDIEKRFDEYMISPKTIHRGKECKRERL